MKICSTRNLDRCIILIGDCSAIGLASRAKGYLFWSYVILKYRPKLFCTQKFTTYSQKGTYEFKKWPTVACQTYMYKAALKGKI